MDHIHNHFQGIAPRAGVGRVEHQKIAGGADQFRAGVGHVIFGGGGFVGAGADAERIEPGVEFQAALVAGVHGKSQGIIIGLGRLAHFAGEILRPRLDFGIVERVAAGADLQDDGVDMQPDGEVENGEEFGLLPGGVQAGPGGPIQIVDGRHPKTAKFPRGRGRRAGRGLARRGRGPGRQRGGGAGRRGGATREEQDCQPQDLAHPCCHQGPGTNQYRRWRRMESIGIAENQGAVTPMPCCGSAES